MHRLRKESVREEEMDYSNLFVVLMGLGTVFAGLLCIILLVSLMSWVCTRTAGAQTPPKAAVPAAPAVSVSLFTTLTEPEKLRALEMVPREAVYFT